MNLWSPDSWRNKPVKHIPEYADQDELNSVLKELSNFPPLVFAGESRSLKEHLAKVCEGKHFYYKVVIALKVLLSFIQTIFVIFLNYFYKCH